MTTTIEVEPQPRIDTLVRLPDGTDARRTEYAGVAWFDGKPDASGQMLRRPPHAPRGIRFPNFRTAFFLPDSFAYHRHELGSATLSVTTALCGTGAETSAIVASGAAFVDDPSGAPAWIQVHIHGYLGWPAGISYRVIALAVPDAVR